MYPLIADKSQLISTS